jgi:lipoprotein-anchoring transpeptidase ErfK/SrfK
MIVDKRHHYRWARFLLMDDPNDLDVRRYWRSLASGEIPRRNGGRYAGVGGLIGIHGSDKEELNHAGVDWTLGCVSLATKDARELYALVPEGTLVYMKD